MNKKNKAHHHLHHHPSPSWGHDPRHDTKHTTPYEPLSVMFLMKPEARQKPAPDVSQTNEQTLPCSSSLPARHSNEHAVENAWKIGKHTPTPRHTESDDGGGKAEINKAPPLSLSISPLGHNLHTEINFQHQIK